MYDPTLLAVCAAAMSSRINWSGITNSDRDGIIDIFKELAQFSAISTQLLYDISLTVTVEPKGCYLSEVDGDFAVYFSEQIKADTYRYDDCKKILGQYAHEFFSMTKGAIEEVGNLIHQHTGYEVTRV